MSIVESTSLHHHPPPDPLPPLVEPEPLPLFVFVLVLSLVELLPALVPEPVVVPEPVPEPEPLTEPEPVPDPVPLVVPERVDDEPSEQPYTPRPRLNDKTAAVKRYLWFFIDPPFSCLHRYAQGIRRQPICHFREFISVQDLIRNVLVMWQVRTAVSFGLCMD